MDPCGSTVANCGSMWGNLRIRSFCGCKWTNMDPCGFTICKFVDPCGSTFIHIDPQHCGSASYPTWIRYLKRWLSFSEILSTFIFWARNFFFCKKEIYQFSVSIEFQKFSIFQNLIKIKCKIYRHQVPRDWPLGSDAGRPRFPAADRLWPRSCARGSRPETLDGGCTRRLQIQFHKEIDFWIIPSLKMSLSALTRSAMFVYSEI